MGPLDVQFELLRGGGAQRLVQLRPEPPGPAQLGQQGLLRVVPPACERRQPLRRPPDVTGGDMQARFVGGLETELDPPPSTLTDDCRRVGRHHGQGVDDLVVGRLDQPETGPDRAADRVALPGVQLGTEGGQRGGFGGEPALRAGQRRQPAGRRPVTSAAPDQVCVGQHPSGGGIGEQVQHVGDQHTGPGDTGTGPTLRRLGTGTGRHHGSLDHTGDGPRTGGLDRTATGRFPVGHPGRPACGGAGTGGGGRRIGGGPDGRGQGEGQRPGPGGVRAGEQGPPHRPPDRRPGGTRRPTGR